MFLFDTERTGRLPHLIGERSFPEVVWEKELLQSPAKAPESAPVLDAEGNIYFGCHDNSFYSLTPEGKIRWQFVTNDKIYSSPLLLNNRLYFCCNRAEVICLDLHGKKLWSYDAFSELQRRGRIERTLLNVRSYLRYDYEFGKYMKINAWASPNLLSTNLIVATLYGVGVVALEADTGNLKWKTDLGTPYFHLAGVAITELEGQEFIAAVSQSNGIFWLDQSGNIQWKRDLVSDANSWGNPSIDAKEKSLYCSTSKGNKIAWVYKFDFNGNQLWKKKLPGGIRGTVTISHSDFVLVPCLNGCLYYLDKRSGAILTSVKMATTNRGLWTSASLDLNNFVLINTKSSTDKGALIKLDAKGNSVWKFEYGKALSVPVTDEHGNIYTGTWDGKFIKLRS